ncbi:MAG: lysine--tRNA ligase [Clostridia bacterium]|nr:lysine--tRNA ligase [Clostridia bacterium]
MANIQNQEKNPSTLREIRIEKLNELKAKNRDPFEITKGYPDATAKDIRANFETFENKDVCICGRMMSRRNMGKANFIDIYDGTASIQAYIKKDEIGAEEFDEFKKWDIGDIISLKGFVFKTQRGEISIHGKELTLLSKSLLPLPEKYHGLKDTDLRYRQRYLDLIMNPDVKNTFESRSKIISSIRNFLEERGFIEVETPMLNVIAGGASAKPFVTHHNALDIDLYLRIAPELYLKRLIIGGMNKVYEIGRQFRNEGMDIKHNPEFTAIELYEAYSDYNDMMDITEEMIRRAANDVCDSLEIDYQGTKIDLSKPFIKLTMAEAVKKYTDVDFMEFIGDDEKAKEVVKTLDIDIDKELTWGNILNEVFEAKVEEHLTEPTFIYDYPIEVSPLTKKCLDTPLLTQRFELFITGREFANAYSELNDPIDQHERFKHQAQLRAAGDEEANMPDDDFVTALEYAMPPTGGMGMGIDRLVMFLTDSYSIRDVLLFPTMKPLKDSQNQSENNIKSENKEEKIDEKIDFSNVEIEPLFEEFVDFETFSKSDFRAVKVKDCVAVPKSKKLLQFTLDDGSEEDRIILSGIHAYYEPEELIGKTCIAITNLPPRKMMGIDSCGMLISAVHSEKGEEKLHLLMVDNHIPAGAKLY